MRALRPDVQVTPVQLLDVAGVPGSRTMAGLRANVEVAIRYLASWLAGNGAAAINNLAPLVATILAILVLGEHVTLPILGSTLVIVAGTPLDFRLGYGSFGPKDAPARVVHVADAPGGIATHVPLAASASSA